MCFVAGGLDYSGVSQLLTFLPGENELCTSFISILGDNEIESTEVFQVSLSPINNDINLGSNFDISVIIFDDDRTFTFTSCMQSFLCDPLVAP